MDDIELFYIYHWMAAYILLRRRRNYSKRWVNRRWWVRNINKNRNQQGDFSALFQELKDDTEMFFRYTRMSVNVFYSLLELVEPFLRKNNWRALCPEQRLSLTLRYLATGDQLLSIAFAYRIGESTVSSVIKHTCTVLSKVLAPLYVVPPTSEKWEQIAADFLKDWNIPNCVGAFDGKHVHIQAPPNSGSVYFNYKKSFSIVLMAACDSNYKFTLIDVGTNGSISDGSIFASSEIGQAVKYETLNVPQGQIQLPGSNQSTPYFFIGDQAFPLMKNFMRPYAGRRLEEKKQIFNYRLSRARRTIENAFGILSARWRVYRRPICLDLNAVDKIVISTVCLHNFLKTHDEKHTPEKRLYCPPLFVDLELENGQVIEGTWRNDQMQSQRLQPTGAHRASRNAMEQRDILADYFVTQAGEIPWQYDYIRRGTNRE